MTAPTFGERAWSGWQRFWFTPQRSSTLTAMRVLLGATCLAWALSILPDLRTFYFDDGLLPTPRYASNRLGLFQWFTSDLSVVVVWSLLVCSSVSLIVGRGVRLAAPVLWLTMLTMQQGAVTTLNAGDLLIRAWTAYFALFAILTPRRFLEVPLFGRRGPDGTREWPLAPAWVVRLAQIQLTVIYPATVIAKLEGDTWREGTASLYALGLVDFERFWVPAFLREALFVGNLMTWFTIAVELSLPFLLWTQRTRRVGIILGILMHAGFDYTMRLGFFFPAMLVGYLAFLRPDEVEWGLRRIGRALGFGRRSTDPDERGPAVQRGDRGVATETSDDPPLVNM